MEGVAHGLAETFDDSDIPAATITAATATGSARVAGRRRGSPVGVVTAVSSRG